MIDLICPECVNDKHVNCTAMVPTEEIIESANGVLAEIWKPCACSCGGRRAAHS